MFDSRFQSVHLESLPRREEFRLARARLRGACGSLTLTGDAPHAEEKADDSSTLINPTEAENHPELICWLMDKHRVYPLRVGPNSIGRLPDNDVVLDDPCVSRRHCAIIVHRDLSCELHDIASKNGTLINGQKLLGPTKLQSGDEITLCDRRLTFLMASGPPKRPAPTVPAKTLPGDA